MGVADTDVWTTVHAERESLASDLDGLDDAGWATTSLCREWSVRDVLAHMTGTAKITGATFLPKLLSAGFSLSKMQAADIARERGSSPADALGRFRAEVNSTKHPPAPIDSWLGEVLVHAEDIRRPLGISHAYPAEALGRAADFYKRSNLVIGAKRRIAGLSLRATDAEWRAGDGPEVAGPMLSLLMAMTGRVAAIDDLSGDGVATLRSRP
jgi:uncharacterized protein (TIGR03083 family)